LTPGVQLPTSLTIGACVAKLGDCAYTSLTFSFTPSHPQQSLSIDGWAWWWSKQAKWCRSSKQNLPVQTGAAGGVGGGKVQLSAALCQRPVSRISGEHHWR